MTIDQCVVKQILIDTGSSATILFKEIFRQMAIPWDRTIPYAAPLVGFTGQRVKFEAKIHLPIKVGDTSY